MKGDKEAQEWITVEDTEDLSFRHNFTLFLEANRDRLALVGEMGVCR
jgi:hypothetical protein